eukprot:5462814-Pleurochrysis_carterae.AAC.1
MHMHGKASKRALVRPRRCVCAITRGQVLRVAGGKGSKACACVRTASRPSVKCLAASPPVRACVCEVGCAYTHVRARACQSACV